MSTMSNNNTLREISEPSAILGLVAVKLPDAGVPCLLVGGLAVNHYGYTRNTLDIDWMIVGAHRDIVWDVMKKAGFTNVAIHESVMFCQRPGSAWRIDFLFVDDATMDQLLSRSERTVVQGKTVSVPSLKDLIAMKLFSLAQNPARRMGKDLPDIAHLTVLNGLDLEKDIHPLAVRYASEAIFDMVSEHVKALVSE